MFAKKIHSRYKYCLLFFLTFSLISCGADEYDWKVDYPGGEIEGDAKALAVADNGDTYITGSYRRTDEFRYDNTRMFINKYSSTGGQLWTLKLDGLEEFGVEIDGTGKDIEVKGDTIYALGSLKDPNYSSPVMTLYSFTSAGELKWKYVNAEMRSDNIIIRNDAIYLLGTDFNGVEKYKVYALKISEEGNEVWRRSFELERATRYQYTVTDSGLFHLVLDRSAASSLITISDSGEILSETQYGADYADFEAKDITYDADGNVYVFGSNYSAQGNGTTDGLVLKLTEDGTIAWAQTLSVPLHFYFNAYEIQWHDGSLYATGNSNTTLYDGNAFLFSLDTASGDVKWRRLFDDGVGSIDIPVKLKLTATGEPLVLVNDFGIAPPSGKRSVIYQTQKDGSKGKKFKITAFEGVDLGSVNNKVIATGNGASAFDNSPPTQTVQFSLL